MTILNDLLSFAAAVLVPDGRLSFWMPTADDVEETLPIPTHGKLELIAVCVQPFGKCKYFFQFASESSLIPVGSRRLITYRKRHSESCPSSPQVSGTYEAMDDTKAVDAEGLESLTATMPAGTQADDLNPFRKRVLTNLSSCVTTS